LALPLSQWKLVATNGLTGGVSFTITAANAVSPGAPQQLYIFQAH
jgi:hypothetical protein